MIWRDVGAAITRAMHAQRDRDAAWAMIAQGGRTHWMWGCEARQLFGWTGTDDGMPLAIDYTTTARTYWFVLP